MPGQSVLLLLLQLLLHHLILKVVVGHRQAEYTGASNTLHMLLCCFEGVKALSTVPCGSTQQWYMTAIAHQKLCNISTKPSLFICANLSVLHSAIHHSSSSR